MARHPARRTGPDPDAVSMLSELARELDQLRCRAARGTGKARVSLSDLAHQVGIPRSTVHTYVSGRTLPPVEALDRIVIALGASPSEQARWADAWFRVAGHQHDQRQPPSVVIKPTAVGPWQIEQICKASKMFSDWQHIHGGWALREAMRAEFRQAAQLLNQRCPEHLRPRLCQAVARFAHATGFSAFDIGENDEALRYFRLGLACAEESDDWHLRAFFLTSMARQAAWMGRPDHSLTFAEGGLVRAARGGRGRRAVRALRTRRRPALDHLLQPTRALRRHRCGLTRSRIPRPLHRPSPCQDDRVGHWSPRHASPLACPRPTSARSIRHGRRRSVRSGSDRHDSAEHSRDDPLRPDPPGLAAPRPTRDSAQAHPSRVHLPAAPDRRTGRSGHVRARAC
jgi:hypothetical protein